MTAATATAQFTCTQAKCAYASKCDAASFGMSSFSSFVNLMMGDTALAVSLFVLIAWIACVIFVAVPVAMMILASAIAIILGLRGPDSAKRRTQAMPKLP